MTQRADCGCHRNATRPAWYNGMACPLPRPIRHDTCCPPSAAERVEATDLIERSKLLLDRIRNLVLCEQFTDGAVLPLRARAVIAKDIKDDGVLAHAQARRYRRSVPRLGIHMLDETSETSISRRWKGRSLRGCCPMTPWYRRAESAWCPWNPAEFFWRGKCARGGVPAVVEFAFVLIRPLLEDVVRSVSGARRPIHEEWLVGSECLMAVYPVHRFIGQILGQGDISGSCGGSIGVVFST